MGAGTPKAAGSRVPTDRNYHSLPLGPVSNSSDLMTSETAGSPCYRSPSSSDHFASRRRSVHPNERPQDRQLSGDATARSRSVSSCSTLASQDIPEQLADLLMRMIPGPRGEELGDAFRWSTDIPPITKQSLSELNIEHIITNIRLRHDVSFDRDLSFRPNFDGLKGQAKRASASRYWHALAAELELYVRLFQGSPPLSSHNRDDFVRHAQRRIPIMFETIKDVLKNLVPDRDYSRVEENLDVSKFMQEIERGVCDFVRLAEWLAQLLKEHCAPMRDVLVDEMVARMRRGSMLNDSEEIVNGLRQLMGILEAMKLDVANHQIRNLKALLIKDTVSFERHYHLEQLVSRRARINIDIAHSWYKTALTRFMASRTSVPIDVAKLHLEVFVKAVVSGIFSHGPTHTLPETFYLDHDRLVALRRELDDLVYFEICYEVFGQLVRNLGFASPLSQNARHALHASLSAIVCDGLSSTSSPWLTNSENISLELVRQAHRLCGHPSTYDPDMLSIANQHLRVMFSHRARHYAAVLESYFASSVLATVTTHMHSPPLTIFNDLVPDPARPTAPLGLAAGLDGGIDSTSTSGALCPAPDHFADISNRLAHIILLHWRVWGPIAYVHEDDELPAPNVNADAETEAPSTKVGPGAAPVMAHGASPVVDVAVQTGARCSRLPP